MIQYHPLTNTIVPPFDAHKFDASELYPLAVIKPDMSGGDTIVANTPTLDGDRYVMTYTVYAAGSPEQAAILEGML
jgi:hypothetical protein